MFVTANNVVAIAGVLVVVVVCWLIEKVMRLQSAVWSHGDSLDNDHQEMREIWAQINAVRLLLSEAESVTPQLVDFETGEPIELSPSDFGITLDTPQGGITQEPSLMVSTPASEAFESAFDSDELDELRRDKRSSRICLRELEVEGLAARTAAIRGNLSEASRRFENARGIFERLQNCCAE